MATEEKSQAPNISSWPHHEEKGAEALPGLSLWGVRLLVALAPGPLHGYGIRKRVEQSIDGYLSEATLYDQLKTLIDHGYIERNGTTVVNGRERKLFKMTGLGCTALQRHFAEQDQLRETARSAWGFAPSPGIVP